MSARLLLRRAATMALKMLSQLPLLDNYDFLTNFNFSYNNHPISN